MSKHTPGPWGVFCKEVRFPGVEAEHKSIVIYGNDGEKDQGVRGDTQEEALANAKLIAAVPELLEALIALTTNKHLSLGDLVYHIRDRELEGWEGPSVKAWSDAVTKAENAIAKATK